MAIQLLPKDIINKIAAGEVIERPASVVKEAVENSIDAGATNIEVTIEAGGLQLLQIKDNGSGMDKEDAKMAFVQHATSKLATEEDLEAINTLGFRGEALASIASVADNTLHTFDGNSEPILIKAKDSEIQTEPGPARSQGTTLRVRNIFASVPARKKFLRSENTEYKHIQDTLIQAALSHPRVGFTLIKDGRETIKVPEGQTSLQRISDLFSNLDTTRMLAVDYDGPDISVSGYVSHPELTGRRSGIEYTFLNDRSIKDKLITKAVKDGFSTTIPREHRPQFVIFIKIKPDSVDVNVHPRKAEVRFTEPGRVFSAVRTAIAGTLERNLQQQFRERAVISEQKLPELEMPVQKPKQFSSFDAAPRTISTPKVPMVMPEREIKPSIPEPQETFKAIQLFNTYLVIERNDAMLVIDQHAADERVRFEQLSNQLENDIAAETQGLLVPTELNLSTKQKAVLAEYSDNLRSLGFVIEETAGNEYQLYEVPAFMAGGSVEQTITEILDSIEESDGSGANAFDEVKDHILATMACHSSIRAGDHLQEIQIKKLLIDLFRCTLPYSCPHGRPIIWEVSRSELEKQFMRRK